MSRFLSPAHAALRAYVPGEQPRDRRYIKLNTNESPDPPAPAVIAALDKARIEGLNRYPDPEVRALRALLADANELAPENIVVGNGSDEILTIAYLAFCDRAQGVAFPDISYGFYAVYADLFGVPARTLPLQADFTIDPADYFGAGRTILLANPNAPTGLALSHAQIEAILRENPDHVVIIDEAYVAFGGESCAPLVKQYENLIVVRTFSKSHALAGARLGYALADRALIEDMNRIRYCINPYNVNALTARIGEAAVCAEKYYQKSIENIVRTRAAVKNELEMRGFICTDSRANFLFVRSDRLPGAAYYERLKERGVLIRRFGSPRIQDFSRVTIGSPEDMRAFLEATDRILEECE
ncbi:MAG: histidinol-phosphate transaminase [Christensenellales bacterium]|jgi:histidinol-phosphate aminotransferase